jgi:kynurenine formamidase
MDDRGMRVRRIVDLSIPLDANTQVYPGDPEPELRSATRIETHGYNVLSVAFGSHTGTHTDAPYHFLSDGNRLEDLDLDLFIGPTVIADVRGHEPRSPITWGDLEPHADGLAPGTILAVRTGWSDAHYGTERYFDHPFLDPEACSEILQRGVRTLAVDALSPDPTVLAPGAEAEFPVHHQVLGAGGVIAENLIDLGSVNFPNPLLSLLPIRLGGDADGAPCRAVALELDRL